MFWQLRHGLCVLYNQLAIYKSQPSNDLLTRMTAESLLEQYSADRNLLLSETTCIAGHLHGAILLSSKTVYPEWLDYLLQAFQEDRPGLLAFSRRIRLQRLQRLQ